MVQQIHVSLVKKCTTSKALSVKFKLYFVNKKNHYAEQPATNQPTAVIIHIQDSEEMLSCYPNRSWGHIGGMAMGGPQYDDEGG